MADNIHKIVVEADTSKAVAELKKLSDAMKNYTATTGRVASSNSSLGSSFSGLSSVTSKFGMALTGAGIAVALVSLGKAALTSSSQVEQIGVSFEVFTGSAETAKNMLMQLKDQALKSPMQFQDITKGAQTLLGYGLTAQQVIPITKMLGDISGGNADKFGRLSLAFGQVVAAGRLMGQETRQMINAGFNPLQAISDKTGKSMAQLTQDMKNGKISVNDVAQAFVYATSEGGRFFGMAEKQALTVGGALNKLSESIFFATADLGAYGAKVLDLGTAINGLTSYMSYLTTSIKPILDNFKQGTALGYLLGKAFDLIKGSLVILVGVIDGVLIAFNKLVGSLGSIYQYVASKFPSFFAILEKGFNATIGNVMRLGEELSKTEGINNVTESLVKMRKQLGELEKQREVMLLINPTMVDSTSRKIAKLKQDIAILESTTAKKTTVSGFSDTPTGIDKQLKETNSIYAKGWNKIRDTINGVSFIPLGMVDDYKRLFKINEDAGNRINQFWDSSTAEKLIKLDASYKSEVAKFKDFNAKNEGNEIDYTNVTKKYEEDRIKILKESSDRLTDLRNKARGQIFTKEKLGGLMDEFKNAKSDSQKLGDLVQGLVNNDYTNRLKDYGTAFYAATKDFNLNLMTGFAEMAGTAIASGMTMADTFKSLGAIILSSLGDYLIKIGTAAIAAGTVGTILKAFFTGGAATVPELGIAGGMAAVAVGSAMKALSGRVSESMSTMNPSGAQSAQKTASSNIAQRASGSSYQYGGSSYSAQSIKLSIDLTGAITASPTGYNINKSMETVLRVTGR